MSGPEHEGVGRQPGPGRSAGTAWRFWTVVLLAGAAAGVAGWLAGEGLYGFFRAPMSRVSMMGYISFRATPDALMAANIKNATAAYGASAAALGVALGLAGGAWVGQIRRGLLGGLIGAAAGVVLTGLLTVPALIGYWNYFGESPLSGELMVPLATHAVCWAGAGVAGGLALGYGAGGDRRSAVHAAVGGLIGAVVGAVAFEFAGASFFALDKTTLPISATAESRFAARMAVALGVSVFAMKGLPAPRRGA